MTTPSLPRIIDPATARRMARMRMLRLARGRGMPSWVRRHALLVCMAALTVGSCVAALVLWRLGVHEASIGVLAVMGGPFAALTAGVAAMGEMAMDGHDWSPTMRYVGSLLGSRLRHGSSHRLAWLDQYWLGELAPDDIAESAGGGSVAAIVRGYPVLVRFDPAPIVGRTRRRIDVFLAGSLPAVPPESLAWLPEVQRWLATHGFTLQPVEGGLRASATPGRLSVVGTLLNPGQRHEVREGVIVYLAPHLPTGDALLLVEVVHAVATAAALLHAEPMSPLPR
jgi:hypothetical protein